MHLNLCCLSLTVDRSPSFGIWGRRVYPLKFYRFLNAMKIRWNYTASIAGCESSSITINSICFRVLQVNYDLCSLSAILSHSPTFSFSFFTHGNVDRSLQVSSISGLFQFLFPNFPNCHFKTLNNYHRSDFRRTHTINQNRIQNISPFYLRVHSNGGLFNDMLISVSCFCQMNFICARYTCSPTNDESAFPCKIDCFRKNKLPNGNK